MQYVLGTWAFRSLELQVDRRVLIPGPRRSRWWRSPWSSWPAPLPGATTRATMARWSASTRGPARAPSPCRWPSRGLVRSTARGVGDPCLAGRCPMWPAPTATPWWRPTPGRPPGSPSPRAGGSPRCRRAWPCGSTSVVSNPPYVSEAEFAGLYLTEPRGSARRRSWRHAGRSGVDGTADIEAVIAVARAGRGGTEAWWSNWRRRRPTGPSTPPSRRVHRVATARDRPVACACWWRRDDPGDDGVRVRRRASGGRGPGRRGGGGRAHRHRLRAGRRPGPARRRGTTLRTQGPTGRRAPARGRRRGRAGRHGGRSPGVGGPAPGRPLLARAADPGRAAAARVLRRPRRPARWRVTRSVCGGPTIR